MACLVIIRSVVATLTHFLAAALSQGATGVAAAAGCLAALAPTALLQTLRVHLISVLREPLACLVNPTAHCAPLALAAARVLACAVPWGPTAYPETHLAHCVQQGGTAQPWGQIQPPLAKLVLPNLARTAQLAPQHPMPLSSAPLEQSVLVVLP